jgi:hypothetical protein
VSRVKWTPKKVAFLEKHFAAMISGDENIAAAVVRRNKTAHKFLFKKCRLSQKQVMDKLQGMKRDFCQ